MSKKNFTDIQEVAQMVFDLVHGKKKMDLLRAYSYVHTKYKINFTYDEIKDYLFHNELERTVD